MALRSAKQLVSNHILHYENILKDMPEQPELF
jgi:hypothetical protein